MKKTVKLLALSMAIVMMFLLTACKNDGNSMTSDNGLNYGDEIIDEIIDDDDADVSEIDKTSGNKGNKDNTAASYNDNLGRNHKIDEDKKKALLDSIPSSLKGQEVSILTWWNPFDYEIKKMNKFTEKTGIKIKWVYADLDAYTQKLASLRAQGNAPDIACIRVQDYPSSIMRGYFRPLSESKLDLSKTSVFDIESMNLVKWDGQNYGAIIKGTTYITMGLLMYNADLFDKYGVTTPHELWKNGKWNWDTFVSISQQIQSKSKVTACTAGYQGYRLAQTGGEDAVAFSNGKLVNNTSSKNYRDTYKWITDLIPTGQYKIMDFGLNRDGFMKGKAAMLVEENWALQAGERFNNLSFTLGYAPLPCKTTKTIVPADFQLWGFPTGSKHLEAASYALEYWQDPAYNETGYEIWLNDSVAAFNDWLWEQPKTFKISQGIIEYGGDYNWYTYNYEATESKEKVDSAIDKWSSVIDANIKKIYSEFN